MDAAKNINRLSVEEGNKRKSKFQEPFQWLNIEGSNVRVFVTSLSENEVEWAVRELLQRWNRG